MNKTKKKVIQADFNPLQRRIYTIKRKAAELDTADVKDCLYRLQVLRGMAQDCECWLEMQLRKKQIKDAKRKVKKIIQAGIKFKSIVIDNVRFDVNEMGQFIEGSQCEDDDIPF